MSANTSTFLDILLKKIEVEISEKKNKSVSIKVSCESEDFESIQEYENSISKLEDEKIIKIVSVEKKVTKEDDVHDSFYELISFKYTFEINHKIYAKFMIDSSRVPEYWLTMNNDRNLILNGKYILCTPQYDSANYFFVDFCMKNKMGKITHDDIANLSDKKPQRFHTILNNLNIAPNLNNIFFTNIGSNSAEFRIKVTKNELSNIDINKTKINKFIRTLQKIKK